MTTSRPDEPLAGFHMTSTERRDVRFILEHDLVFLYGRVRFEDRPAEPALVDEAIQEYRRYMILNRLRRSLGLEAGLPMGSREVDAVWHAHLLFTRDYAAFCERAFGHFLHHDPTLHPPPLDEALVARSRFLDAYARVFGAPSPLWGAPPQTAVENLRQALDADAAMRALFRDALPELTRALIGDGEAPPVERDPGAR